MDGVMPSAEDEIALDRMYADNNDLKVGDTVSDGGITWKITALVALPDYSCLFEDNSDTMFDSVKFGVAVVSDKGFERFDTNSLNYDYAWKYHEKPAGEIQEKEMSEDLLKGLADEVTLSEYLPLYQNQAIQFTGDDMGGDMAMIVVMLYMVIVILCFRHYNAGYDREGGQCHRYPAGIRLYQRRAGQTLYAAAGSGNGHRCGHR